MEISKDKVVSIDYTLTNDAGQVVDTSEGRGPLAYLHGHNNLITGLEKELTGQVVGAEMQVTVPPDEAYGVRDEALVVQVPRSQFDASMDVKPGMQFQAETESGKRLFNVAEVKEDQVVVDGNHPLAGERLHFKVTVRGIREAAPEEIEHGHVHEGS